MSEVSQAASIDSDRLIDTDEVLRLLPISRVSLYYLRRRGEFPAAVRISPNRIAWKLAAVRAWVDSRPAA